MDTRLGQSHISSLVSSFTNLSKVIVVVLVVGYVVSTLFPASTDRLALSCGRVFAQSWTLFTHGLFVTSVYEVRSLLIVETSLFPL